MNDANSAHARHTVLAIDDEQKVVEIIRRILESDGFVVRTATSAREALRHIEVELPSLALVDLKMPEVSGLELCRRMQGDARTAHVPIILVTGCVEEEIEEGIAAGAVDYIKKPFDNNDLRFRVRAQLRHRETLLSQERTESLLSIISGAARDAIVVIDDQGRIAHWNEAAESLFGYGRDEALGRDLRSLLVPQRLREEFEKAITDFRSEYRGAAVGKTLEMTVRRKTGEEFPAELSLASTMKEGRWFAVGFARDIARRKHLEGELMRAHKLEAVGQLAAGIAHEINTPTQYVGDNTRFIGDAFAARNLYMEELTSMLLSSSSSESEALKESIAALRQKHDIDYYETEIPTAIAQTLDGVERISSIVVAMKEFSHPGSQDPEPFDVNHAVQSTVTVARNEWKYVSAVSLDLGPNLPLVLGFQNEFRQAVLNVVVNAAHAIADNPASRKEKGRIKVKTRREDGEVVVRISDNGNGIPPEIRDRIFDPFFTTKEVGRGTGQGLTVVHAAIVGKHRGRVEVESEVGVGTTFTFRIPFTAEGAGRREERP
jgi:two-component system, NtrC family, sensor kinase